MRRLAEAADIQHMQRQLTTLRDRQEAARVELGVSCMSCLDSGIEATREINPPPCRCAKGRAVAAERETRRRADYLAGLDVALSIPTRFTGLTLETYPDQGSAALERVRRWSEGARERPGLYLCGPAGRGKSVLAAAVLRERALADSDDGRRAPVKLGVFWPLTGLLERLRRFEDGVADEALDRALAVPWLALDDLGSERLTDWGADRLFEIVNARHNAELPLIVTSNFELSALADRLDRQVGVPFGARLASRLVEGCDVIRFGEGDPDWRMEQARSSDVRR